MVEKRKLEFFLLRYVADAVKGEFVNIGLVALQAANDEAKLLDVCLPRDWERVLRSDPQADVNVFEAMQRELQREIGETRERAALLRRIEDSFSGALQMSPVIPVLTEKAVEEEIQTLAKMYLESPKLARLREPRGRQAILDVMADEFEKAGVSGLIYPVPAETYTKPGDPFAFDFGYNTGREIKLFHAVSMKSNVDAAVLLATRYPRIAPAMARMTSTPPLLTAVVESGLDRGRKEVAFALEMMEESRILVAETTEMAGIAETARRDLGA